jgi:hypothetical protein
VRRNFCFTVQYDIPGTNLLASRDRIDACSGVLLASTVIASTSTRVLCTRVLYVTICTWNLYSTRAIKVPRAH